MTRWHTHFLLRAGSSFGSRLPRRSCRQPGSQSCDFPLHKGVNGQQTGKFELNVGSKILSHTNTNSYKRILPQTQKTIIDAYHETNIDAHNPFSWKTWVSCIHKTLFWQVKKVTTSKRKKKKLFSFLTLNLLVYVPHELKFWPSVPSYVKFKLVLRFGFQSRDGEL